MSKNNIDNQIVSTETNVSIFNNPIYKTFLSNLDYTKIIFNKETKTVNPKDIIVRIRFSMTQNGIQPMSFNNNFDGVQKADDGTLIMSAECFNRHAFGQNDLQSNFSVNGIISMLAFLRGGIKTDKEDKKRNVSFTKAINTSVRSTAYKALKNDRLGFKADDNGENYLCEETLYLNTIFDVKINVPMYQFLQNINGTDFAQTNALKIITATDKEVTELINSSIPTKENIINIDSIADIIISKIKDNIKHFSHRGIIAEFIISNLSVTADTL